MIGFALRCSVVSCCIANLAILSTRSTRTTRRSRKAFAPLSEERFISIRYEGTMEIKSTKPQKLKKYFTRSFAKYRLPR